ncbi:hypothetical protein [Nocardia australiensis]|uniref:hypothetical protein n=1 Tax=Nocardia australiensis TaxID=2887191 RepID=UPI001D140D74|nr:hypothetical protein [Nocardia australiensis]
MHWLVLAVLLVMVGLILDRIGLWAEQRGWIYWRKRRPSPSGGAAAGMLGDLQAVLSPSYRHVVEETESKKVLRLNQAAGDGHRSDRVIDLDGGTIRYRRNHHCQ